MDTMIIGNPDFQADYWQLQSLPDDCAIMAQVDLLNQFGINISETQAVFESAENGWYVPGGGTMPEDVGQLMALHGVPTHSVMHAGVADLAQELQQGHGVIVGVNSSELWETGPLAELKHWLCKACGLDNSLFNPADHAIVVTGMDLSDPSHPMVMINDSGSPEGQGHPYPLDKFMDAWSNSDFYYTATDQPIPHDDALFGDMSLLDCGKWLVGGIVGGATLLETGDPFLALSTGMQVASSIETYFADPAAVRNL